MRPLLVCVGLATLDVVQVVQRLPRPDEKVVASSLRVTFGGPAANAAATAVALGVPSRLVTAVGSGPVARLVADGLDAAGVEVVDLARGAGRPPVSTVLVTAATGERAVISVNGTTAPDLAEQAGGRLPSLLDGATALLVDGHHLGAAVAVAAAAQARGVPVLLDGGSWKAGLEALLAVVDHAVLSADFVLPAGGARGAGVDGLLAAVAALGPTTAARSAGAGPVRLRLADGRYGHLHPPALRPEEVVDTLGAGDVLHGATAAGLARGEDIVEALRAGVEAATRSVRHAGARGWVPEPPRLA